jgi:hypothetical protein
LPKCQLNCSKAVWQNAKKIIFRQFGKMPGKSFLGQFGKMPGKSFLGSLAKCQKNHF